MGKLGTSTGMKRCTSRSPVIEKVMPNTIKTPSRTLLGRDASINSSVVMLIKYLFIPKTGQRGRRAARAIAGDSHLKLEPDSFSWSGELT